MRGLPLSIIIIANSLLFVVWQPIVVAEERVERIQAGKKFLSDSRIDEWEKLFTEGAQKMGRIVVRKDGKVVTEAWFENQYKLGRIFDTKNRVTTAIANPDYFAQVRTRDGESRIGGVFPPVDGGWVYVNVLPFMIGSSSNFTNPLIAQKLKSGNLQIYDYRFDANRHFVELEYTEEADKGLIELVFDDDVSPLLPVETTFGKGTPYARHFISSDFRQVAGYMIPHKVEEMNDAHDVVTTEFFPDDRLDPAMCRLSYYGLPEPGELNVSDFGRRRMPWLTISLIVLAVAVIVFVSYILTRRRLAQG